MDTQRRMMKEPQREWQGTNTHQYVNAFTPRIPEYDKRSGNHLWTIITMYRVDPLKFSDPTATPMLDMENLLTVMGPGCYYCEQLYTPLLAMRRCKGE